MPEKFPWFIKFISAASLGCVMYVSFSYFENCPSPSWLNQSLTKTQYTPFGTCVFGLVWFFEVGGFLVWGCGGVMLHLPLNSLQLPTSSSGPTGSCHSQLTFSALRSFAPECCRSYAARGTNFFRLIFSLKFYQSCFYFKMFTVSRLFS